MKSIQRFNGVLFLVLVGTNVYLYYTHKFYFMMFMCLTVGIVIGDVIGQVQGGKIGRKIALEDYIEDKERFDSEARYKVRDYNPYDPLGNDNIKPRGPADYL